MPMLSRSHRTSWARAEEALGTSGSVLRRLCSRLPRLPCGAADRPTLQHFVRSRKVGAVQCLARAATTPLNPICPEPRWPALGPPPTLGIKGTTGVSSCCRARSCCAYDIYIYMLTPPPSTDPRKQKKG